MKTNNLERTLGGVVLTLSLLSGVTLLSVTMVSAQGRHGGDSGSRGSSSGGNRSSAGGSSRGSSSGSRNSPNVSHTSTTGSRSSSTDNNRGARPSRDRSRQSSASSTVNTARRTERSGNHDRVSEGGGERGSDIGRVRDHGDDQDRNDRNRDRDRDHHHHRGWDRDNDCVRRHNLERARFVYRFRSYQSSNYGGFRYGSNAYDQGYQDGLYTGSNDGRRGQTYDPERSHFYKNGASGFLSIFGSPSSYSLAYRDGFLRGYDEGYQHYETYFSGGSFHR